MRAWWKWGVLLAVTVALEIAPGDTLSEEFWHGQAAHGWIRYPALAFAVLLTGHLLWQWVKRWNPR